MIFLSLLASDLVKRKKEHVFIEGYHIDCATDLLSSVNLLRFMEVIPYRIRLKSEEPKFNKNLGNSEGKISLKSDFPVTTEAKAEMGNSIIHNTPAPSQREGWRYSLPSLVTERFCGQRANRQCIYLALIQFCQISQLIMAHFQ